MICHIYNMAFWWDARTDTLIRLDLWLEQQQMSFEF